MDAHIARHKPLIARRTIFSPRSFPHRPKIARRMEFSSFDVKPGRRTAIRERSETPDSATQGRTPTPKSVSFSEEIDVDATDSHFEDEEDEESGDEINKLIPKPRGEAGRPGSGGYSLQEVLNWSERTYEAVVDFVHESTKKKHLDLSKSYSKQDKKLVKEICEEVRKEYRVLDDYKNYWPVHDMLKLLKYTSEASRRAKTVSATKKIDKIIKAASSGSK